MTGHGPYATLEAQARPIECELPGTPPALTPRTTQISLSSSGMLCRCSATDDGGSARVIVTFGKLGT